jgi:PAS domain-containing protein
VLDKIRSGVIVVDGDDRILDVNAAAKEMLGL